MDAALDAYIRDQALGKWRETEGLIEGTGMEARAAVENAGDFLEKGPYREIWRRWWQAELFEAQWDIPGGRFAAIEAAVRGAVVAEREERRQREDVLLEDTLPYQAVVTRAMEKLLLEAGGEIEEDL